LKRAKAIVAATTYFDQPDVIAKASEALGLPMRGIEIPSLTKEERLATRGWSTAHIPFRCKIRPSST